MATSGSNTVILGAGIIGVSTAYYLSLSSETSPQSIHLVEVSPELFASASGYAGGFLAKDWFAPPTAALGSLSFSLHKELADEHNGYERWGYSRSTATSLSDVNSFSAERGANAASHENSNKNNDGIAWLMRGQGQELEIISTENTVAQVDPYRLCKFLLGESLERGVRLHHPAQALSISTSSDGRLSSITISEEGGETTDLPCSRLVITAGAWSPEVFATLFPGAKTHIPVESLSGHSLILRTPRWNTEQESKGCHAIFTDDPAGYSPEAFSRIGGEIYLAGVNDAKIPLPKVATDAKPYTASLQKLRNTAKRMFSSSSGDDDIEIIREGLCFRPVTRRGPPVVSRIPDSQLGDGIATLEGREGGVFLSAGHGPWGIAQSLGTGKVLSEMIESKPTSVNVQGLKL